MTPYQEEELENIRRQAEDGRRIASEQKLSRLTDVFQNILDNYERVKNGNVTS